VSRDRIFGSTGKQLKVWNLQTAQLEALLDMEPMDHLVISTDGKRLAGLNSVANSNGAQLKVWQIPNQSGLMKRSMLSQSLQAIMK
jgi:hypothetical protein